MSGKAEIADTARNTPAKLVERQTEIRQWWRSEGPPPETPPIGLALSGGGIRSATFSLGLIQALARSPRDAFARIDILSTVSGGGYIGCFLRSLFVPQISRGIAPGAAGEPGPQIAQAVLDQHAFAREALRSGAHEQEIKVGTARFRNPIWWLREHSRYLAPNGPTDYGYAIAYIARNWLAMLFIFMLAVVVGMSLVAGAEVWLSTHVSALFKGTWITLTAGPATLDACGHCAQAPGRIVPISPLVWLAAPCAALSAGFCVAYWLTHGMSANERNARKQWRWLAIGVAIAVAVAVSIVWLSGWLDDVAWPGPLDPAHNVLLAWIILAGFVIAVMAIVAAIAVGLLVSIGLARNARENLLTAEVRRILTKALAQSNQAVMLFLALGLIDSCGAALAYAMKSPPYAATSIWAIMLPVLAFVIKKLPEWFSGTGGGTIFNLIQRFLTPIALVVGLLLYGTLAVAASALVHHIVWSDMAWGKPDIGAAELLVAAAVIVALAVGKSGGFINLSSLHMFYMSRLTRAYLGATNQERLALVEGARQPGIKENDPADYIQPSIYSRIDLPAPIHIINSTINETIDPQSELVARDRKGDILTVGPDGIRIGKEPAIDWPALADGKQAQQISLGQWCAISGAAASSGMGRLTNLGYALALTFANVRLGYWWWSPGVGRRTGSAGLGGLMVWLGGTFVYLWDEMTARYSRYYQRKYLTDGGHFENSGAYALIRRHVQLILVSDNGADPDATFADLENLVRKVRLDLGGEATLLGGPGLTAFLHTIDARDRALFVDPDATPAWRDAFTKAGPAIAVVLRVAMPGKAEPLHLLWIKPRLLDALPADVGGYALANPSFPQQSTGDQFFDEAQWESYRKLGELTMSRLLEGCPKLLA